MDGWKDDPDLKAMSDRTKKIISGETTVGQYTYDNDFKYATFAPAPDKEYFFEIEVSQDEVIENEHYLKKIIFIMLGVFLVLSILFILLISICIVSQSR